MGGGKRALALALCIAWSAAAAARPGEPRFPCGHFHKLRDGNWQGDDHAVVIISGSRIDFSGTIVRPTSASINGQDLYRLIQDHCARNTH